MRLLISDVLKHRRTWVGPLTLLGPVGLVLMGVIDFALRPEWLEKEVLRSGAWLTVLNQMGMLDVAAIALGVALLCSMIFDVDHRSLAWKQLFALPVSRVGVYLVKLAVVMALLFVASVLAAVGVYGIWQWLDLGAVPWRHLAQFAVLPCLSAFPLVALQGLLSAHIRNQAVPLTLGVAGVVAALFGAAMPGWAPWAPLIDSMAVLSGGPGDLTQIMVYAAMTGAVLSAGGAIAFARRDVM
jgi:hypothetical protein